MYKLFVRSVDKGERDYIFQKEIDLESAIEFYELYDWNKDFQEIKKRNSNNLSSMSPAIIMQEEQSGRKLIITSDEDGNTSVDYEFGKKGNSFNIPSNAEIDIDIENVQSIITRFFSNEIELIDIDEINYAEYYPAIGKNRFKDYIFSCLRLPIVFILFLIAVFLDIKDLIYFTAFLFAVTAISDIPILYTLFNYRKKEGNIKHVALNKTNKQIEIHYADTNRIIIREDIKKCVYNFSPSTKTSPYIANLVLLLSNNEEIVFTSLTFDLGEFNIILRHLDIQYYTQKKWIACMTTHTSDEKIKCDYSKYTNENELKELYKKYTDQKLLEIVNNKEDYQDLAVNIARNELKNRKITNGNNVQK